MLFFNAIVFTSWIPWIILHYSLHSRSIHNLFFIWRPSLLLYALLTDIPYLSHFHCIIQTSFQWRVFTWFDSVSNPLLQKLVNVKVRLLGFWITFFTLCMFQDGNEDIVDVYISSNWILTFVHRWAKSANFRHHHGRSSLRPSEAISSPLYLNRVESMIQWITSVLESFQRGRCEHR